MQLSRMRIAVALVGAALALGCAESIRPGMGTLEVRLTDAPFPFSEVKEVNVHVMRVDGRLQGTGEAQTEDASNMNGWVTVASPNALFDLLTLQGGVTANLGAATLATGNYNSFRLVLDTQQSNVVLNDGTVLSGANGGITFPSAGQTGIKVVLSGPVEVVEGSSVMVLDFDVGRSFVLRGNSIRNNGLLFKPVIRATASEFTGRITGQVRSGTAEGPVVVDATVELLKQGTTLADANEENVVATTSTDASGNFTFAWILPGTYEIRVTPPAGSGLAAKLLPGGVTVASGQLTTATVLVLTP